MSEISIMTLPLKFVNHNIEDKTFWDAKPTMVLVPPSSWAKIKAYIIKMCEQTGKCTNLETSLNKIDSLIVK